MGGALFVPHQNMFYVVLMENGIVDVQNRATRIAKYKFDTFIFKTLDKNLSATEFQFYALEKLTKP
ncbi:hypothetical protein MKFW12EY_33270 [Methylomonas koyamae]|nr:hypothetical protein MKFW12EY_33270 [Methylomonas koyamae]